MGLQYFKISRPLNLLLMVATMVLARLYVVEPVFDLHRQTIYLEWTQFGLMALATVLIAMAGYWLNDHQDVEADNINRPDTNPIGKQLHSSKVMKGALVLTLTGVVLGNALAIWLGAYRLGFLYTLPAILLWLYNAKLKHLPLVGNVVVSVLVGLVPMLPGIHELALLNRTDILDAAMFNYIWIGTLGYGVLAFGINIVREVVKDIQDMQGDDHLGSRTLPLVLGEKQAKFVAILLTLALIRAILYAQQLYLAEKDMVLPIYLAVAIQLPLLVAIAMLVFSNSNRQYARVSLLLKLIAVAGVGSMLLYNIPL
ncbi:geranylgeranylglycerol-phosphate geranylgeranyltransferase [soil metagenome]